MAGEWYQITLYMTFLLTGVVLGGAVALTYKQGHFNEEIARLNQIIYNQRELIAFYKKKVGRNGWRKEV